MPFLRSTAAIVAASALLAGLAACRQSTATAPAEARAATKPGEASAAVPATAIDEGWRAYYAGRHDEAEAAFRGALEAEPEAAGAQVGLAWSLLAQKDRAAARPLFEQVLETHPTNGPALAGYGRLLEAEGDLDGAIAAWKRMADAVPGPHEGVLSLARVYLERNDCVAAQPYLERLLDGVPPDWALEGAERCSSTLEPPTLPDDSVPALVAAAATAIKTDFRS